MALFGRKRPKTFEGNALASCRRLRPDADWKHDKGADQITGDGIVINLANLRLIWEAKEDSFLLINHSCKYAKDIHFL